MPCIRKEDMKMPIAKEQGNDFFTLNDRWKRHEPSSVLFIANLFRSGMQEHRETGTGPAYLIREIGSNQTPMERDNNVPFVLDLFAGASMAAPFRSMHFANHPGVPSMLRGRKIETNGETEGFPGLDGSFGDILATCEWGPVWCRKTENGKRHDTIAVKLPQVNENDLFLDHFTGNRFPAWVPLVEFLREASGETAWNPPKLRASFQFDDPNLHWPAYGCVDFRRLAHEAEVNNYHVSFATIPLDSWMVSSRTAEIFGKNKDRLSLLIHGNNHTYRELVLRHDDGSCLPLLAQALRRIERLERVSGVPVSRIMAPPHGPITEAAMRHMVKLGFLGVCTSFAMLKNFNRGCSWLIDLGFKPGELIFGLPLLMRYMGSEDHKIPVFPKNQILMSAYLGRAIVLLEHHLDLSDGVDILQERSEFINSIGDVEWTSLEKIADLNYSTKKNGADLFLRSYSRRLKIQIPDGVQTLKIQVPRADEVKDNLVCTITGKDTEVYPFCNDIDMPVAPGMDVELRRIHSELISHHGIKAPPFRPWPIIRRLLIETRDRLQPIIHFPEFLEHHSEFSKPQN